ncbi:tripartite tricarboxylate transporter TctB family protein [Halorarum salinum]|uniref:Tripartite tricarboxylate transporter TctB family protein n=1 Tax=Halorarum salinum TaxID=2743089 RepID=A0A7D5L8F2_9EURY|nr:tripartite tricarboxylate transporter TctB family protein [Halobaculum salinum]QLG60307.1 tripartite tricarboxylate transporter TctB family protein [Halobaculum salinum]
MPEEHKKEVVELLVAIAVLIVFLAPAMDLEGPLGQFPRIFLFAGVVFLSTEVVIRFLPEPYRQIALNFSSGLTNEMTEGVQEEVDEKTNPSAAADNDAETVGPVGAVESDVGKLFLFLGVLGAFYAISYLVGFLPAIPLLTFAIIYLFGKWNWKIWLVTTALLVALIYGLFGEVMNIPITEGELL